VLNDHFKPTYSVDNTSHAARRKAGQLGGRYMATFSDYFTIARRQWTCTRRHYMPLHTDATTEWKCIKRRKCRTNE